jgi:uncharacterized protein (TIGR03086 family)
MADTGGELFIKAMESAQKNVNLIKADQWAGSTPCTDWDVKELVNHLIGEYKWAVELLAGKTTDEVGTALDGDLTGGDPLATFNSSIGGAKKAAQAPGAMDDAVCHLSFGDYLGNDYTRQLFLDSLIHGWDLAVATGSGHDVGWRVGHCVHACC